MEIKNVNRSEENIIKLYKRTFHLGITACIVFLFVIEYILLGVISNGGAK